MTDPIQHLRDLLEKHNRLRPQWDRYGSKALFTKNEAMAIRAVINTLPALLAVAEAAKLYSEALDSPIEWDHYQARKQVFLDALAAMEKQP